jgi:DNA-binding HxlR family transcriptional regulator
MSEVLKVRRSSFYHWKKKKPTKGSERMVTFVIHALGIDGKMRFLNLEDHIERISQRMLTKWLRELERDGLVSRSIYPEVHQGWNMN